MVGPFYAADIRLKVCVSREVKISHTVDHIQSIKTMTNIHKPLLTHTFHKTQVLQPVRGWCSEPVTFQAVEWEGPDDFVMFQQ